MTARPRAHRSALPGGPRRSLLWLVVSANVSVLAVALVGLASTPLTVSWPTNVRDGIVLALAIAGTVAIQALVVRWVLTPLGALHHHMQHVDPLHPGTRIDVRARSIEVADLVDAFNAMLDRLEAERRDSARRTQAAQEAERRWLSLELHDQIGQDLTALLLGIDVARRVDGDRRQEALAAAAETAKDCLERVRSIVHQLRPAALDQLGLTTALVQLCDRVDAASGVHIERRFGAGLPALSTDAELGVFRVAQESLTNVVRHAHAREVALSLEAHDGGVRLTVADDGAGLPDGGTGGSGIRGMRERALLLGARLELRPRSPRGTEVVLDVPASEVVARPADDPGHAASVAV